MTKPKLDIAFKGEINVKYIIYPLIMIGLLMVMVQVINPQLGSLFENIISFLKGLAPFLMILFGIMLMTSSGQGKKTSTDYLYLIFGLVLTLGGVLLFGYTYITSFGTLLHSISGPIIAVVGAIVLIYSISEDKILGLIIGILMIIAGLGIWSNVAQFTESFFGVFANNPIALLALIIIIVLIIILWKVST